jgi:hypothetical protein
VTRRTYSKNIYAVAGLNESVSLGYLIGPFFHLVRFDFNRFSAIAAYQMVVVGWVAGSVEHSAILGLQAVGIARFGQIGQCPINSGQSD